MKNRITALVLTFVMISTCFVPVTAFGAISSVGSASLVNSKVQNNAASTEEQVEVYTEGSEVYISGRTQLPPLECTDDGDRPAYVGVFVNMSDGSAGGYATMFPSEEYGTTGEVVYVFSGSCDLGNAADGTYILNIWRGKFNRKNIFGNAYNTGILSRDNVIRVSEGKAYVVHYPAIQSENTNVIAAMDAKGTEVFLDPSLDDIRSVNREPNKTGGAALTASQTAYMKTRAEEITAGCTTDYERVKAIYEFVAGNFYYDKERNTGLKSYDHPYYNLYNMDHNVTAYNAKDGKVATACSGYSALVAALTRALGIPTRVVKGVHPAIESKQWTQVSDLTTVNHYWTECYVDGRWIMVDANMGTQNSYVHSTGTWQHTGVTNYTWFDPTDQQKAVHYLYLGDYQMQDSKIKSAKLSGTSLIYNGKQRNPYPIIYNTDGELLVEGTDYDVAYSSGRTNVGRYKVTVTLKGKYYGTKEFYFNILPKAPTSVTSKLYGYDDVQASWSKVTGASGYFVYYKKSTSKNYTLLGRTTKTTANLPNLADGSYYYIKIVPYFLSDGTRYASTQYKTSGIYTLKKLPAPVVSKSGTKVKVKWTNINGESGYQISRSTSKTGTNIVATYATTKGTYKYVAATRNKTYYYKVRAYKTVGKTKIYGPWSSVKAYKRK